MSGRLLVSSKGGANVQIKSGDTLGEECIITPNPKLSPLEKAADTIISEDSSYLLMVSKEQYANLKKKLFLL